MRQRLDLTGAAVVLILLVSWRRQSGFAITHDAEWLPLRIEQVSRVADVNVQEAQTNPREAPRLVQLDCPTVCGVLHELSACAMPQFSQVLLACFSQDSADKIVATFVVLLLPLLSTAATLCLLRCSP